METQAQLIKEIEAFMKEHGMAESTFGRKVFGIPGFVQRLRSGVSPTLKTVGQVKAWMKEYNRTARKP